MNGYEVRNIVYSLVMLKISIPLIFLKNGRIDARSIKNLLGLSSRTPFRPSKLQIKIELPKKKKIIEILTFFVIPILMPRTKMLISISFLSECLCTNAASIWFLSAMNTFMIFQSIRSMKTFFTCATTITSFITMNQTMLIIN